MGGQTEESKLVNGWKGEEDLWKLSVMGFRDMDSLHIAMAEEQKPGIL